MTKVNDIECRNCGHAHGTLKEARECCYENEWWLNDDADLVDEVKKLMKYKKAFDTMVSDTADDGNCDYCMFSEECLRESR